MVDGAGVHWIWTNILSPWGAMMGWLAIAVVLLCLGAAALWARYNPDRDHTRPPTYRPDRRSRRVDPLESEPFRGI
jgi:hypothetical protein